MFVHIKVCFIDATDGQMAYFRERVYCEMMRDEKYSFAHNAGVLVC